MAVTANRRQSRSGARVRPASTGGRRRVPGGSRARPAGRAGRSYADPGRAPSDDRPLQGWLAEAASDAGDAPPEGGPRSLEEGSDADSGGDDPGCRAPGGTFPASQTPPWVSPSRWDLAGKRNGHVRPWARSRPLLPSCRPIAALSTALRNGTSGPKGRLAAGFAANYHCCCLSNLPSTMAAIAVSLA